MHLSVAVRFRILSSHHPWGKEGRDGGGGGAAGMGTQLRGAVNLPFAGISPHGHPMEEVFDEGVWGCDGCATGCLFVCLFAP